MNTLTPKSDTWWVTYLKAVVFLIPPLVLWALSIIFVVPKIQQICADAGGQPLPGFIRAMLALSEQGFLILGTVVVLIALLEWRAGWWTRYRRVVTGVSVFVFNTVILSALFVLLVTLTVVAPGLAQLR
jgi:hypothetical protein